MEPKENRTDPTGEASDPIRNHQETEAVPAGNVPENPGNDVSTNAEPQADGIQTEPYLPRDPEEREPRGKRFPSPGFWIALTAVLLAIAIILTFTLTSALQRRQYSKALEALREDQNRNNTPGARQDAENLKTLENILQTYSFYADSMDAEAMLHAAFRAYVDATGDRYAAYYTQAEYDAMNTQTAGRYVGIGVTFEIAEISYHGEEQTVFRIISVEAGSPAEQSGILAGEYIVAVETSEGVFETVSSLGYDGAVAAIRGEEGTTVRMRILHDIGGEYTARDVVCTRSDMEQSSVDWEFIGADPTVAHIRISMFALNTPEQFNRAMEESRNLGITKFVFDVRDNPGGDLLSIRAILSGFLREGDLILEAKDRDGTVRMDIKCEPVAYQGDSAGCSVAKEDIGRYRDLDFVVLCNKNTASAAEVFTATMRDYGLARAIVGKKTFGKGIMQSIFRIPFRGIVGYIKLTTYEYVTACGESYHEIGIAPDRVVERKAGTEHTSISRLTLEDDLQLQTAVQILTEVS